MLGSKNTYVNNITNYPDTININEYKAPTDASIRYMEEAHDKAMKNIIARVKIQENSLVGECFCLNEPYNLNGNVKIVVRFKINGKQFNIEKELRKDKILREGGQFISNGAYYLKSEASAIMLWYALKMLVVTTFEQINGKKLSDYDFNNL